MYEAIIENYKGAVNLAQEKGYNIGGKYWVNFQGESNIQSNADSSVNRNYDYETYFLKFHKLLKNELGITKGAMVEVMLGTGEKERAVGNEQMYNTQEYLIRTNSDIILGSSYPYDHYVPDEETYNSNAFSTKIYVDSSGQKIDYSTALERSYKTLCFIPPDDKSNFFHFHSAALSQIGRECATNLATAVAYTKKITFDSNDGTGHKTSKNVVYGKEIGTLPELTRNGYIFNGWYFNPSGGSKLTSSYQVYEDETVYAQWTPMDNIKYTVKHWQQNVDADADIHNDENYTLKDTEELFGTAETSVTPETKNYEGFTSPTKETLTINVNGTAELNYYYTRNSYKLTLKKSDGIDSVSGEGVYQYGKEINISANVNEKFVWINWTGAENINDREAQIRMPNSDIELQANAVKKSSVTVQYIDISNNKEISTKMLIDGYEGKEYQTQPAEIEGYTYIKSEGINQGNMTSDPIVVKYYYAKKCTIVVKCKDIYTDKSIVDDIIIEGYEGKEYVFEPTEKKGYVYVEAQGNLQGKMPREGATVICKYGKITSMEVHYVDEETKKDLIDSSVIEGYVGKTYDIKNQALKGYAFSKTSGNEKGIMTEDKIIVYIYYLKEYGVTVKYVDINSNEEIEKSKNYDISNTKDYDVTEDKKEIKGYTYIKDSDNTKGTMSGQAVDVVYWYAKNSKLITKYIDMNSNEEIATSKILEGYEGKEYTTEKLNINNYQLIKVEDEQGKMTREDKTVIYYYKKNVVIQIQYIDKSNNNILKTVEREGCEGDEYDLSNIIDEIDGYSYIATDGALKGKYDKNAIIKIYYENSSSDQSGLNKLLPNAGKNIFIIYVIGFLIVVLAINYIIYRKYKKP